MKERCSFVNDGGTWVCPACGLVAPSEAAVATCDPSRRGRARQAEANQGPGSELKKLLAKVGIQATPNCSCNKRAAVMDARGCDWCEQNLDEIVGWLREEAEKRKLPFLDMAGRVLVRRAIANARRKATV